MRCEKVVEMLSLYIDNELNEKEKNDIEEHLKSCESCSREYEDLLIIKKLLSETPEVELPKNFKEELHEKLVSCSDEDENKVVNLDKKKANKYGKKKYNWKILSGIAAGLLITIVSASTLINNDFSTKQYSKAENDQLAPQEAVPFNLAMEKENALDGNVKEESNQYYEAKQAKLDNSRADFRSTDRGNELSSNRLEKSMDNNLKIIISNGYINLEIEDYNSTYNKLIDMVTAKGGFIQNSNKFYKDVEKSNSEKLLKEGNVTLRVPKDKFENMFNSIKSMGTVMHKEINQSDVTIQYKEIFDKRENLYLDEKNLRESVDKAEDLEEIPKIKEELNKVLVEIDRLTEEILRLNDLEASSTIQIYLKEKD